MPNAGLLGTRPRSESVEIINQKIGYAKIRAYQGKNEPRSIDCFTRINYTYPQQALQSVELFRHTCVCSSQRRLTMTAAESLKKRIIEVKHMHIRPIQMDDVIYNAADQCFEALVTVHDSANSRRYACSINAPITTSFRDAARGLSTQAERRHIRRGGIFSEMELQVPPHRSGRPRFDAKVWLEDIAKLPGLRAA